MGSGRTADPAAARGSGRRTPVTRTPTPGAQAARDPSHKPTDVAALRAIAQAAVDVELFTIPLYMTSLYSIGACTRSPARGTISTRAGCGPAPRPRPIRQTREREGVQHRLLGLHPGDAPPPDGGQHGDGARSHARFHQRGAAERAITAGPATARRTASSPTSSTSRTRPTRTSPSTSARSTRRGSTLFLAIEQPRGGRQGGDQGREGARIFPGGAVRRW